MNGPTQFKSNYFKYSVVLYSTERPMLMQIFMFSKKKKNSANKNLTIKILLFFFNFHPKKYNTKK